MSPRSWVRFTHSSGTGSGTAGQLLRVSGNGWEAIRGVAFMQCQLRLYFLPEWSDWGDSFGNGIA